MSANNSNSNKNLLDSLENNNSFEYKNNDYSSTESNTSSIWSTISNLPWFTWVLIFFVLAILGFNILNYLSEGVDLLDELSKKIVNVFRRLMQWVFSDKNQYSSNTSSSNTSSSNTSNTSSNISPTVPVLNNNNINNNNNNSNNNQVSSNTSYSSNTGSELEKDKQEIKNIYNEDKNTINQTLNQNQNETIVQSDDSYSSIQSSKISGKSGWCFIGEDRGVRSCLNIGPNDTCMSGDIFPTNEICINPNLRV
jgi:hypothetical protein